MNFIQSIPTRLWVILACICLLPLISVSGYIGEIISPGLYLYIIEPLIASAIAISTFAIIGGAHIRVRHTSEKALMVIAIVAVWFVLYFLSGLILTYVRNSLVTGIGQTLINISVYSITATALEYTRYKILASVGKRHIKWFAVIVSVVFALTQLPYSQMSAINSLEELIKVVIASVIPALAASFLLTYLALTSGLMTMLAFRLGMVAIAIVPPIIPNFDWYLIGTSYLLLTLAIYLIMDRQLQHQTTHARHHIQHLKRANDLMFVTVLIGLAAFMSGFFSYRPLAIVSNSMQPVYSRGAMVVIQRLTPEMDIEVGDIVQYESAGKTITHRVVAIDAASDGSGRRVYKTKGDNSPSPDPTVGQSQIGGIVRAQIPYIGYPTIWLRELAR